MTLTQNESTVKSTDLDAKYQELLNKMRQIDKKYSLDYIEPELDLPESLGLEKKTFTMPSTEELTEIATTQHSAELQEKQFEANKETNEKIIDIESESAKVVKDAEEDLDELLEQYNSDSVELEKNCIDNGLGRSSIRDLHQQELLTKYQANSEKIEKEKSDKVAELAQKVIDLKQALQAELDNLQQVFQSKVTNTVNTLLQEAYKQKEEVLEYNNNVDQKENEYKFDREKAIFDATMDEADRAFRAAELLAQMGETGMQNLIMREKVSLAKTFLAQMPKQDALYLLETGEELKGHLGQYYAYVVDYIENL